MLPGLVLRLQGLSTATFAEGFEYSTVHTAATSPPPPARSCGLGGSAALHHWNVICWSVFGGAPHRTWAANPLGARAHREESRRPHFSIYSRGTDSTPARCHEGAVYYPRCGDAGIVNLPRGTSSCEQRGTSLTAPG